MGDNSNFAWADLSTFDLENIKKFYSKLFGWQYQSEQGYNIGLANNKESSGICTMPEKFKKINMPSFWMSYVQVSDIESIVKKSEKNGGKVEVYPEDFGGFGKVALIRDPSGAGFTVYQGKDLKGKDVLGNHGRMTWNELYVSDLNLVQPFYENVFGWKIKKEKNTLARYKILNQKHEHIATIQVLSNEIKGDKEFWGVYFSVDNLDDAEKIIKENSGKIISKEVSSFGKYLIAEDPCGAFFYLLEGQKESQGVISLRSLKWRAGVGIGLVYVAVVMNLTWVWGIIFLVWVIPDLKTGSTYFFEAIHRKQNPIMYWIIVGSWLWLSLFLFSGIFYPDSFSLSW